MLIITQASIRNVSSKMSYEQIEDTDSKSITGFIARQPQLSAYQHRPIEPPPRNRLALKPEEETPLSPHPHRRRPYVDPRPEFASQPQIHNLRSLRPFRSYWRQLCLLFPNQENPKG